MMSSLLTIWVKQLWSPASTVIFKSLADRKFKKVFFPSFFSFLSSPALLPPKKKETKGVSERSDLKTNGYFLRKSAVYRVWYQEVYISFFCS